jgi:hypothetical protein
MSRHRSSVRSKSIVWIRVLITGHVTSFPSDGMPTDPQASYDAERAKGRAVCRL